MTVRSVKWMMPFVMDRCQDNLRGISASFLIKVTFHYSRQHIGVERRKLTSYAEPHLT